jgi:hypothetical protein
MNIYQSLANIKVDADLKKNETVLKEVFRDANDIVFRNMKLGQNKKLKILLFYVDGMTTKDSISEYAVQTLMESIRLESLEKNKGIELENKVLQTNIAITELGVLQTLQECVDKALSGETILFIDTCTKAIWLSSRGWQLRGIQEPAAETLIRGARDGFIETMKINITLIRRSKIYASRNKVQD